MAIRRKIPQCRIGHEISVQKQVGIYSPEQVKGREGRSVDGKLLRGNIVIGKILGKLI